MENIVISLIRSITFTENKAGWWKAYVGVKQAMTVAASVSWKKEKGGESMAMRAFGFVRKCSI